MHGQRKKVEPVIPYSKWQNSRLEDLSNKYSRKVETYLRTMTSEWKTGKTITKYLTVSLSKLRAGEARDISSHSPLQKKKTKKKNKKKENPENLKNPENRH